MKSPKQQVKQQFKRQIIPMLVIAVIGWVVFLLIFRTFWPGSFAPGDDLTLFWVWLAVGTAVFTGATIATFRFFKTPPAWRTNAAVALTAPALCLDALATIYFEAWFPNAGPGDARIYSALILGAVGVMLLVSLFMTKPDEVE